ncbi:hypothetical protein Salat_2623200 [Sesamum alatum]|uniref:DUF4283 domain-containing protein n=1 Tax=Sesamum alatum TaxID=300844 RepID=A0AAE2CAV1_9LAMI|nr:hypothetical protein Salat_2623200 [Sesamum alatum]
MERVTYARILVEVDASKSLVDRVEFMLPNGVTRKQTVEQQGPAKPKQAWTVAPQRIPSHQPENVPPSPADLSDSEDKSSTGLQPAPQTQWGCHLIKSNNLCLLGILETKLAASAIPRILHRSFLGWCQVNNFDLITGGHILVIWNPAIIDLQSEDISQRSMWEKLSELGQNLNRPWLILGDFNCVRSPEEKLGVTPTWYELKDSLRVVSTLGTPTVKAIQCGASLTGCLGTMSGLRRACTVILTSLHRDASPTTRLILFLFLIPRKLKALKGPLKTFNNLYFSHISVRVKEADLALQDAQVQLESDPENANLRDSVGNSGRRPFSSRKLRGNSTSRG